MLDVPVGKIVLLDSGLIGAQNQKRTFAVRATAEKKSCGHLSKREAVLRQSFG